MHTVICESWMKHFWWSILKCSQCILQRYSCCLRSFSFQWINFSDQSLKGRGSASQSQLAEQIPCIIIIITIIIIILVQREDVLTHLYTILFKSTNHRTFSSALLHLTLLLHPGCRHMKPVSKYGLDHVFFFLSVLVNDRVNSYRFHNKQQSHFIVN